MSREDLMGELRTHQNIAAKLRMDIELKKEKNSAKYKAEKKQIARIQTVLASVPASQAAVQNELKKQPKTRTVRAPKKS